MYGEYDKKVIVMKNESTVLLNGYVMSGNKKVVQVQNGLAVWMDRRLAPLYFRYRKDLEGWFHSRLIDGHRTNSRLLKRALRLKQDDSVSAALFCHAATITDTYWYKQEGENLTYQDVRFTHNFFDQLALRGDPNAFSLTPEPTPEVTNTGSFEKCWKLENQRWWMYKHGTPDELLSELFIGKYAAHLHFPVAEYVYYNERFLKTPDFTNNAEYCLEEIYPVVDGNDNYEICFNAIGDLSEEYTGDRTIFQEQYLQILYVDSVCYNMDRHAGNFGFLRDPENGKVVSMAPNYDNNTALVANGLPNTDRSRDGIIQFLKDFLEIDEGAKTLYQKLDIKGLDKNEIRNILKEIPIHYSREDELVKFIYDGQNILDGLINNKRRIELDPEDLKHHAAPRRDPAEENIQQTQPDTEQVHGRTREQLEM